ncbi:uncharacterized protein C8A04DRAFT_38550 [Dichotomopilus funicola]|uniref:2EXR domain-containing protein n=1 Tax=Dichotomopilus funicola TaxID=1934379 RepID=A0AAN6UZQ3_9PEZI|nr:hypothetical protein C8A04DRAFT_38550 [Dichotomopilus funicola]
MRHEPPTFLSLPVELRLEIYTHLLVLPPPPPPETLRVTYRCSYATSPSGTSPTGTNTKPTLHPQILRVNSQTYYEALPILYGHNTFSAHPVHLTAQPTLYHPGNTGILTPAPTNPNIKRIRRWHLRLRVDTPSSPSPPNPNPNPNSSDPTTAKAPPNLADHPHPHPFTALNNTESLHIHLYRSSPLRSGGIDVGTEALQQLEHIRGIRRVRITGVVGAGLGGMEGDIEALRGRMMRGRGRIGMGMVEGQGL